MTVTPLGSTDSTVHLNAVATTTCPSSIRGTAIGIGASTTTTICPTGHSVTACPTIIPTGALLIMDIHGGDTITAIIHGAITAIITTIPTLSPRVQP